MRAEDAKWIWNSDTDFTKNQFAVFRKEFEYNGGNALLHITADSRYTLYINGEYVGFGPVRAYPEHYKKDVYNITTRLKTGKNVLTAAVNHFGCSTFQYLLKDGGLLAWLETDGKIAWVTDSSWNADVCREYNVNTPRIDCQQQYEEQVDARQYCGWREGIVTQPMPKAVELRPMQDGQHNDLQERGIPFLTQDTIFPKRVCELSEITEHNFGICFDYGEFVPKIKLFNSTPWSVQAGFILEVNAERESESSLVFAEWYHAEIFVNGRLVQNGKTRFHQGKNLLFVREEGVRHTSRVAISFTNEPKLSLQNVFMVGPFDPVDRNGNPQECGLGYRLFLKGSKCSVEEREQLYQFAARGELNRIPCELVHNLKNTIIPQNVFLQCYKEQAKEISDEKQKQRIAQAVVSGGEFTLESKGTDISLLLDFGTESIGFVCFDCFAEAGTIIDFHGFEFVQPDGRKNYAEGMNNTFRYITREGKQSFRSMIRRGFRYTYLTIRNFTKICIGKFRLEVSTYPQTNRGSFVCDDWKLNKIYEVGKNTIRNCAEDTFTDCPTYEQVHWVGDMRNEALIHWMLNGDKQLWFRCLEQVGQSLEYSDITLSQVPSGWYNVLPCWSFLWMRSVVEYYRYTGDIKGAEQLLPYLKKNIEGVQKHINADGLFEIDAWNMFDWAAMDCPSDAVVTHLNCFAVLALRECAQLFEVFSDTYADICQSTAKKLATSVNVYLWNSDRQAFVDCLRYTDGKRVQSSVFSQQTQTVAYMCDVAEENRSERCLQLMMHPEKDFVTAGSPFFEFFYLEAMIKTGRSLDFIEDIRKSWGRMVDTGCDTFWEMWTFVGEDGRLTRSHCHGWSAAPIYFLSEYVLGVTPVQAGYKKVKIEPHSCGLQWCRGTVPTPYGDVAVQWKTENGELKVQYELPPEVEVVQ